LREVLSGVKFFFGVKEISRGVKEISRGVKELRSEMELRY